MFDLNKAQNWVHGLVPIGIVACLMIIFVPLPPSIMDILLAANITIAIIILLTTVYIKTPLELSIFPSLLLATTMFRLALNIATTRLILTRGAIDGELAAGQVIQSFGGFVAGNQITVGLVIFAIIIVVQFVVITKGATRISEVSARFALDGMPGKQMAIDAELNSGNITHEQAKQARGEIAQHADFYGAMDGASKFVRGDAIAGVLITAINIMGGLFIGVSQGMTFGESAATFTTLTIGDGLASQLPALLISVAAGLLLTRGTRQTDLPKETVNQLFSRPAIMLITAGFLGILVFTKLPAIPLLAIAAICGLIAYQTMNQSKSNSLPQNDLPKPLPKPVEQPIGKLLENESLELELGITLIPLADTRKGGTLLAETGMVRSRLAKELGLILPKVRIRDNLSLQGNEFRILLHGNQVISGEVHLDSRLNRDCRKIREDVTVTMTTDFPWAPHSGWVQIEPGDSEDGTQKVRVESLSPTEVISRSLHWVSTQYASELLTRDATRQLVEELKNNSPTVVEELIPDVLSLGGVQQILASLVFEGVSIRPLNLIFEALSDHATTSKDRGKLVEIVRVRLGRQISHAIRNQNRRIVCFGIDEELQHRIAVGFEPAERGFKIDIASHTVERLRQSMAIGAEHLQSIGRRPVLFVDQDIRPVVAWLAEDMLPNLMVLGSRELSPDTQIDLIAEITIEDIVATTASAAA